MTVLRHVLVVLLSSSMTAMAAPATEGSIKELLSLTQEKQLHARMQGQLGSLLDNSVQQELKGQNPTPKQQQAIDTMKKKVVAVLQSEYTWERMEALYIHIYSEAFTEEELAQILIFYRSPAGRTLTERQPSLRDHAMVEQQEMLSTVTPKLKKIQEEFIAEIKAAGK